MVIMKKGKLTLTFAVCAAVVAVGLRLALSNIFFLDLLNRVLNSLQEHEEHLKKHIYLNKNYAPVAEEHTNAPCEVVEGKIPGDLNGLFSRNGPNPIPDHLGNKRYHWFDGHGHMHNLRIEDGKAKYSNFFIPTPRYLIEKERGEEFFVRFGEMTGFVGLVKILLLAPAQLYYYGLNGLTAGQANTHSILSRENKFYACHEGSLPFELSLNMDGSLKRGIGYETFDGKLDYAVSAHPKVDYANGNFIFHSYSADPSVSNFKIGEIDHTEGELKSYFGVNTDDGHTSFGHDMMFTQNWIIIYDNSVHFDQTQVLNETGNVFSWNSEANLKIGLLPRNKENASSEDAIWLDVGAPHVMIHPLNAWEEKDGTVVMWSPCGDFFNINIDKADNKYYMAEFKINPKRRTVKMEIIEDKHNVEFPRVRDDFYGRFAKFGVSGIMDPSLGGDGLFKGYTVWDMENKKLHSTVLFREGDVGGETVVIPKPKSEESHEFYVGTFMHNLKDNGSYFVLYDGETDELIARVRLPARVPYGFHALWLDHHQLRRHVDHHNKN